MVANIGEVYLVGGAVRDELLGLAHKVVDKDWVVVGATVEQMLAAKFIPVGKDFPTKTQVIRNRRSMS